MVFDYNENSFTLEFAALNYIQPDKNRYAYKLNGFDKDWNYGTASYATYTNLSPGKYKFLVKAANNNGIWTSTVKELIKQKALKSYDFKAFFYAERG